MAKHFAISFTIAVGETYDERRNSFLAAIRSHGPTYEDTTSYVLVRTSNNTIYNDIQKSIYASEYNIISDKFICQEVDLSKTWTSGPTEKLQFTYK